MTSSISKSMWEDWAAAWSLKDQDKLINLFVDDCVYEDVAMNAVNHRKAGVRAFAKAIYAAFPDFKIDLRSSFAQGDRAGSEWTMSGIHLGDLPGMPATGKGFSVRGASICELEAGRIKRISDYWDRVTLLQQIGLMR